MPAFDARRRRFLTTAAAALGYGVVLGPAALQAKPDRPLRILHVMSFDTPWRWTDGQLAGFKEGLAEPTAEYRVLQMDVRRDNSPQAKAAKGREARAIIDSWQPDLVYTSDDHAVEFVTSHYLNSDIPFVFSGVNKAPSAHGLDGVKNVTGVLEQEHFSESVRLLQQIAPQARRLAVLSDQGIQWPPVIARIRAAVPQLEAELIAVDQVATFEQFKQALRGYDGKADAVVQLGIFGLKDAEGKNVPYQQVQRWMVENTRLPDISFWLDRVFHGVLASVTVSEHQQGFGAGRLARRILIDGKSPDSFEMKPSVKGHPVINLTRAEQLGLTVNSSLLLSSEVVRGYQWDVGN
jgi:ABC-type uncharacterized transport system substrate-binding protein